MNEKNEWIRQRIITMLLQLSDTNERELSLVWHFVRGLLE